MRLLTNPETRVRVPEVVIKTGYNMMRARQRFYDKHDPYQNKQGGRDYLYEAIRLLPKAIKAVVKETQAQAEAANEAAGMVVAVGAYEAEGDGKAIRLLYTALHGLENYRSNQPASPARVEMARGCIGEAHEHLMHILDEQNYLPITPEDFEVYGVGDGGR